MATKTAPARGPAATAEGYSTIGSQANRVALKPGGTFSGGNRFSDSGPGRGGSSPAPGAMRGQDVRRSARAGARKDLGIIHGPHDRGAGAVLAARSFPASGPEVA